MAIGVLAGCTTVGTKSSEQISCLQPNRRVLVEIGGTKVIPPPKPKPGAKPARPRLESVMLDGLAQGNSAFDPGSAVLKDGGKKDLDGLLNILAKGTRSDKRPTKVGSVSVSGHSDRLESREGDNALSESRAKAVRDYLVSKGIDSKLIFWQELGSKEPMPVTKFCEP